MAEERRGGERGEGREGGGERGKREETVYPVFQC